MKKSLAAVLSAVLLLAGCGGPPQAGDTELTVFAAASLTEALDGIIAQYKSAAPGVTVIPTYDSSGTLLKQIQEGAVCDLFISAAPRQIDALDGSLKDDGDRNPDGLDMIVQESRLDLLENKVTLVVPEGNPKGIKTFDQLAELLKSGGVMLAMGNSDVPVGQYTRKLFAYYGIDEAAVADCLTYGSNVKEVATQVGEGVVDCGVIYATDASAAGLEAVDTAAPEQCGQVIYPAAVLKDAPHPAEAADFLAYLRSPEAEKVFSAFGFSPIAG